MDKLYITDGTIKDVQPKNGCSYSLEELQSFVGGYIEIVNYTDNMIIVVNDEGAINDMPLNVNASKLSQMLLFGNVLVTDTDKVQ